MEPISNSNAVQFVYPHNPYVYKAHYNFEWDVLKPLCSTLVRPDHGVDILHGGQSSYTHSIQPHNHEAFRDFYIWLDNIVKAIGESSMGLAFMDRLTVANSWINVQENGGHTTEHNHAHAVIGVATYLHMPQGSGYFECKDPLELLKSGQYHNDSNWAWKEVPTVSGDVLVFPAWLIHRTQTNPTNEGRWVLTTNYIQDFK